jgi:endonuclease G
MTGISPEELARAERVLESVRDAKRPGVSAVDLGFKWTDGRMTEQVSIRVHLARKKPAAELPPEQVFPTSVDGIPVDVIEATYFAQVQAPVRQVEAVVGRGQRLDVVPLGVSIGNRYTTAGTLGAKVVDLDNGDEMLLSNWHVLVGRKDVQAGLPIWQPGWLDGGTRDDNTIALLSRWVLGPFDAAVARLTGARRVESRTLEGRHITDITSPRLGMKVWKSGRTSGYTEGIVDGLKMRVTIPYPGVGLVLLDQVFRIVPAAAAPRDYEVSLAGDSGAIWVDQASGKAAGLHFAGEIDGPEHALAHDISPVLRRLRVRFPSQQIRPVPDQPPTMQPPSSTQPDENPPGSTPPEPRSFWDSLLDFLRALFGS